MRKKIISKKVDGTFAYTHTDTMYKQVILNNNSGIMTEGWDI